MNMETLKTLLDRIYELEGLVQLALSRNDDASIRIAELIAAKGEAVSRALAAYEESVTPADSATPEGPNPLAEAEDLIAYSLEEEDAPETPAEDETEKNAGLTQADAEAMAEAAEIEEADVADSEGETSLDAEPEVTVEETSDAEEAVAESAGELVSNDISGNTTSRRLRTLFSINDRFRFSRELFGGSTKRFDDSLAYLDSAIDFNEVEDFFFDQGMDPESPAVQEFLDILSRSFGD